MPVNRFTPCVILPGIGQSKVELTDKKGQKIKMAWPPEFDSEQLLGKLKAPLMKMMLFRKDGGFSDKAAAIVSEIAAPLALNPDGTFINPLKTVTYPVSLAQCSGDEKRFIYKMVPMQGLSEKIGEENLFYFAYNPFEDPYEAAQRLDEFIGKIKSDTDSDKVNLIPVSLGGSLSIAYFDRYGYKNDVKRVMYFVAALRGTQLAADILSKNFSDKSPAELIKNCLPAKKADELTGMLAMMPEEVPVNLINKVTDALLDSVLINSPSMWGVVPPGSYEELAGIHLTGKRQALKEKTDVFYNARRNFPAKVRELEKQGTEFFCICGYGVSLFPLFASENMSSDGVINVSSASAGAACAPVGSVLNRNEDTAKVCTDSSHSHISPDGNVDASYGLWPETTWYFASQRHSAAAYNTKALKIAELVLSDDNFRDIYSDADLPQFGQSEDNRK